MQFVLPKWVTKLSVLVLGVLGAFEILAKFVDVSTLPSPWNFYLALVMGGVAGLGRALGDHDNDGTPNIIDPDYTGAKRGAAPLAVILALASVGLLLLACTNAASNARPGLALNVSADEIVIRASCDADAPNVACLISVTDSASGQVLVSESRVAVGQSVTLPPRFCTGPGPVVYTGTFVGVTASGRRAPASFGTGRGTCDPAGAPARPNIVVEIRPGGV